MENSSFELWEGSGNRSEPVGWNGLMSAQICSFCSFGASQRVFKDHTESRSGEYCLRIQSTSVLGGVVVNGSLTTGRITAMSLSPSAGYNRTVLEDDEYHLSFNSEPDSLVFWAKYSITDSSDSALVSFLLHGDFQMTDPPRPNTKEAATALARSVFQTNGTWQRVSVPFNYSDTASNTKYLLATFSSSVTAGKGNSDATLWIDDVEMIYNDENFSSIVQN